MKGAFDKKRLGGSILLFVTTAIWGVSFVFTKRAVMALPAMYLLAMRFLPSSLVIGALALARRKPLDKGTVLRGLLLGVVVFAAYTVQTYGLRYTTPGRNSFITVTYCVLTPFMMWLMYRQKPKSYNVIAAVLCFVGLGFVALLGENDFAMTYWLGDLLTLACAFFYALQIIFIWRFQEKKDDSIWLLFIELFVVGVCCTIGTFAVELPLHGIEAYKIDVGLVGTLLYLVLGATLFCQLGQMLGQKYTTANQSAIILSLESVIGVITSVILGVEKLTVGLVVGFVLIFLAVLMSETKFDIVARVRRAAGRNKPAPDAAELPQQTCDSTGDDNGPNDGPEGQ